jgi:hypothetical protein
MNGNYKSSKLGFGAGIGVGIVIASTVVALATVIFWMLLRRKKTETSKEQQAVVPNDERKAVSDQDLQYIAAHNTASLGINRELQPGTARASELNS